MCQISGGGKPPPPPPSDSGGFQDSLTTGDTVYLPVAPTAVSALRSAYNESQRISINTFAKGLPALPVDLPTGALSPQRTQPIVVRLTHRVIGLCTYFAYADDEIAQRAVPTALSYCPAGNLQIYVFPRAGNSLVLFSDLNRWSLYEPYGAYTAIGNPQFLRIFKISKLPALVVQDTSQGVSYIYEGYLR